MARSFPSCLLSFTYCFSRFILDFFSQTSFISLFLCVLLLCDFFFALLHVWNMCLFIYERAHEKEEDEEVALYGLKKNSLCGTWSWFLCFIKLSSSSSSDIFLLCSLHEGPLSLCVCSSSKKRLLVRAHSSHMCVKEKKIFFLWKNLDRSRQKLVGKIFLFHCSRSLLTSLPSYWDRRCEFKKIHKGLTLCVCNGRWYFRKLLQLLLCEEGRFGGIPRFSSFCSFGGRHRR